MLTKLPVLLLGLSIGLFTENLHAQFADSLQLHIGTTATVATQAYQPLWLVSNRFGTLTDQQADVSTYISLTNRHVYKGGSPVYEYLRKYEKIPAVSFAYGLDLYHNRHFQQVFIQEGYMKINYNHWQLRAGRYEETIGEINPELSSGSLGVSGNALPLPKVSLAVTEYTTVPLTQGWIQFKGLFSHGWAGKERIVKKALLHEKNLYVRIGRGVFHAYGGLNRFAFWGGKHPEYGQLANTWQDYQIIVKGRPIDDARPYTDEQADRRGNHLGFIDYGIQLDLPGMALMVYHQVPFEDRSGVKPLKNPDKLLGVSLLNKNKLSPFSALTVEYIDTRYQSGDTQSGRDNYYNNRLYMDGWSYHGRLIGAPLFTDREKAAHYLQEKVVGADRWHVVNNRIRGGHLGWKGSLLPVLHLRTLMTYTENYGNYFNKGQFTPHKVQWYFLQEMVYQYQHWTLTAALGIDAGELTQNTGILFGVAYDLKHGFPFRMNAPK